MSKARLESSYGGWGRTGPILESLTESELLEGAREAEKHLPISNLNVKELLKLISRIGTAAPGSDEKNSYELVKLKSLMVFSGCPIIFFTINPGECHSPIALYYAEEEIDVQHFFPYLYDSTHRLQTMLKNPLAVVEYFHNMIRVIIEKVLKGGIFGDLLHHYGPIEYQGRYTPHIHMVVSTPYMVSILG
jgi:hypothetical protein